MVDALAVLVVIAGRISAGVIGERIEGRLAVHLEDGEPHRAAVRMANRTGLVIDQRDGTVLVAPDLDFEGEDLVIGEDGGGIVLGGVRVVADEELLEAVPVKINEFGDAKARRNGDVAVNDLRIGVAVLVTVLDAFIEVEPVGNLLWRARIRCRGRRGGSGWRRVLATVGAQEEYAAHNEYGQHRDYDNDGGGVGALVRSLLSTGVLRLKRRRARCGRRGCRTRRGRYGCRARHGRRRGNDSRSAGITILGAIR